jgi:RNA polymerase sigma-70 factor (ECF subfamily)
MSDEAQLIARAAGGNADAFRQVYQLHREKVARLAYRVLGGHHDLEDVVQEVFVQVYKSLPDFRGQSKFGTWLHRVTVNVALMHRRAAKSRPTFCEPAPEDRIASQSGPAPDEDAERRERIRAFGRLLDRLGDKKRVVFVLHELEGVAPSEIAHIVGAPVLTVRTRLFYARRELEAMLSEEPTLAAVRASLTKTPEPGGA